ncbi:hypothetical protein G4B88_019713 [Cannabis sativa]|uniref:Uncharacterized protein n=1 Tax=Cannabis sativa TaxID=3483 RepID=A0A7J6HRU0_CANSA|nr:hypothetical protein G4B88_019713 [Cannabis sativa]
MNTCPMRAGVGPLFLLLSLETPLRLAISSILFNSPLFPNPICSTPLPKSNRPLNFKILMSLRYASRVLYQAGNRVVQGMKDQISRCDSTVKISLRDSSSKQSRAEESLRTVIFYIN